MGSAQFHLLVPCHHPSNHNWTDHQIETEARRVLEAGLQRFKAVGADVSGEIGDVNPVYAVDAVLRPRTLRRDHPVDAAGRTVTLAQGRCAESDAAPVQPAADPPHRQGRARSRVGAARLRWRGRAPRDDLVAGTVDSVPGWFRRLTVAATAIVLVSCSSGSASDLGRAAPTTETPATTAPPPPASASTTTTAPPASPDLVRPEWLGTRPLPLRPDGFGQVLPTPPELVDRRIPTIDLLPPPDDDRFAATNTAVPADVVARSSWQPACPVGLDELRYLTVSFWGFDDRAHTGELLVNAAFADDMVEVFRRLFEARFAIEEMRIIRAEEIDAHPTGDGNTTTSFVCRPAVGSGTWSRHAYGLAVDVNPFHNPYVKGDLVLPELASAYVDRAGDRPGVIHEGDSATQAFDDMGWSWGGRWNTLDDFMHFSDNGR